MWWIIFGVLGVLAIYFIMLAMNPFEADKTMEDRDAQLAKEFADKQALKDKEDRE